LGDTCLEDLIHAAGHYRDRLKGTA
jgi:hypothetical protein